MRTLGRERVLAPPRAPLPLFVHLALLVPAPPFEQVRLGDTWQHVPTAALRRVLRLDLTRAVMGFGLEPADHMSLVHPDAPRVLWSRGEPVAMLPRATPPPLPVDTNEWRFVHAKQAPSLDGVRALAERVPMDELVLHAAAIWQDPHPGCPEGAEARMAWPLLGVLGKDLLVLRCPACGEDLDTLRGRSA
jgi:hypothetical protein